MSHNLKLNKMKKVTQITRKARRTGIPGSQRLIKLATVLTIAGVIASSMALFSCSQLDGRTSHKVEQDTIIIKVQDSTKTAKQCKGTTLKGTQCKRKTTNKNGLCFQHQPKEGGSK